MLTMQMLDSRTVQSVPVNSCQPVTWQVKSSYAKRAAASKPQSLPEAWQKVQIFVFGQIDYSAVQLKTRYQMEIEVLLCSSLYG